MNLQLQPKQFLFLYNCIKKYEKEFMYTEEEQLHKELLDLLENHILGVFEDIESRKKMTGFDKWLKSETNKINGLEDELKKIKESVPQEELLKNFKNTESKKSLSKKQGRPKKS